MKFFLIFLLLITVMVFHDIYLTIIHKQKKRLYKDMDKKSKKVKSIFEDHK